MVFILRVFVLPASASRCLRRRAPTERVGKLLGCGTLQRTMRTHGVVIDAPRFDQCLRFGDAGEPMFVEAFVPKLAIEAFDEGVLDWLAGSNASELNAVRV